MILNLFCFSCYFKKKLKSGTHLIFNLLNFSTLYFVDVNSYIHAGSNELKTKIFIRMQKNIDYIIIKLQYMHYNMLKLYVQIKAHARIFQHFINSINWCLKQPMIVSWKSPFK